MKNLFELFYKTTGVCTDSRNVIQDSLFICLRGSNFNGNEFANEALTKGAKFVISDDEKRCDNESVFYVEDTLFFLQKLANYHRLKFNIPIIGITGSNGKTTSKELINAVLSTQYNVLATIGNLNNHIGVPLTLLNLTEKHQIAIIEMGANKFFDIKELCDIAEPTHGIITNIGKAHLEGFGNFEGVLKTKKELYDSIASNKGLIVYNQDDLVLKSTISSEIENRTYGTDTNADIVGELLELTPYVEFKWKSNDYDSDIVKTHLIGKYNFYNFLAAISFGVLFKISNKNINNALQSYNPTNNRSQVKETLSNTLILDCYNANPTSMSSALESFAQIKKENKIVILGDMLELGEESLNEHTKIIDQLLDLKLSGFLIGSIFNSLGVKNTNLVTFSNRIEFQEYLKSNILNKKMILLKGSRGIGLEKLEELL